MTSPFSSPSIPGLLAQSEMLGQILMAVAITLITASLMLTLLRRRRKMDREKLQPSERLERTRELQRTTGNISQMMVELEELTRRFGAQLDAKSQRLEQLLEEADRKIAELEGRSSASPSAAPSAPAASSPPQAPADPLVRKVYELADAGQPIIEIARQLDEQIGKVELILALRQN